MYCSCLGSHARHAAGDLQLTLGTTPNAFVLTVHREGGGISSYYKYWRWPWTGIIMVQVLSHSATIVVLFLSKTWFSFLRYGAENTSEPCRYREPHWSGVRPPLRSDAISHRSAGVACLIMLALWSYWSVLNDWKILHWYSQILLLNLRGIEGDKHYPPGFSWYL